MGNLMNKAQNKRILFIGADATGKTTMLYRLKHGKVVVASPTLGVNVETIEHGGETVSIWDVTLDAMGWPLLRKYFPNTDVICFFIDSADVSRLPEIKEKFWSVVGDEELRGVPVLVVANKQDKPNALSVQEIGEKLDLCSLTDAAWDIVPVVAWTGKGVAEAIDKAWDMIQGKNKQARKARVV